MSASTRSITRALDEAPASRFHYRMVVTAGAGFFTDAYDLFIIGTASVLIAQQWHLSAEQAGLLNSATLLGAFFGAVVYGRIADLVGRQRVYGLEAALMVVFALCSAFAPGLWWLVAFRFALGVAIGGDYPVSAVLMSEFSNRVNRGRMVGLVFAMQALGTICGYGAALALLASGAPDPTVWRILLGLGAVPSALVLYSRRHTPESPRYQALVAGGAAQAARDITRYSRGAVEVTTSPPTPARAVRSAQVGLWALISTRRGLLTLLGTAGGWFALDYAYYGNAVSAPLTVRIVLGHGASLESSLVFNLIVFCVAALPGYALAVAFMDRVGHRRLQLIGFAGMACVLAPVALIPGLSAAVVPFLTLFALGYFFAEFGPNSTTFVLAAECFPTRVRASGHGLSAGIAKLGAFAGVYLFPRITATLGVSGAIGLTATAAIVGLLVSLTLPEPARRSLEQISGETIPTTRPLQATG